MSTCFLPGGVCAAGHSVWRLGLLSGVVPWDSKSTLLFKGRVLVIIKRGKQDDGLISILR